MHKDPWSNMEKTLNVKAERVFTPGTPADDPKNLKTKEKIIKTDDKKEHLSRFDFMFVDSSKDKRDPDAVLVRDKKGTLRQASVLEKWYKKRGPQEKYVLG